MKIFSFPFTEQIGSKGQEEEEERVSSPIFLQEEGEEIDHTAKHRLLMNEVSIYKAALSSYSIRP